MAAGGGTIAHEPINLGIEKSKLARFAPVLLLAVIILLGAFLRFYHLGSLSIGNTYYAATVKSMLTSWHNFFYASFEPGGSVTVDKPPLGFWIQAISAHFLGVNGFALALPQALAGVLSIPVLYHLVRRNFGILAGLTASLTLALTPITIATERNNTIDGLLVFMLLLAAWAFIKAAESGRLRYIILGAILVGAGFNIKMLQAVMPLPAFYLAYLLSGKHRWWVRLLQLGLATLVFLIVALAWVIAVDLTPADQRPYIGSSTENSVLELIIGHNGLARLGLLDLRQSGPGGSPLANRSQPGAQLPSGQGYSLPPQNGLPQNTPQDAPSLLNPAQPQTDRRFAQPGYPPQPGIRGTPGMGLNGETGSAGPLRLFIEPLVTEASWLLPLGLLGIPLAIAALGWRWPLTKRHLDLLLWVGWLLPSMIYFSFTTGLFHRYYLIMLGPPLAALVGITIWALRVFWQRRPSIGWILLLVLSGATLVFEIITLRNYEDYALPLSLLAMLLWLAGLLWLARRPRDIWQRSPGLSLIILAILIAPFTWSLLSTFNPNPNVALPTASLGDFNSNRANPRPTDLDNLGIYGNAILEFTLTNTDPDSYLLATNSSRDAAPFILVSERAVLTFGGFTGGDNVIDLGKFLDLIGRGDLRFVLGLPQNKPELSSYIQENCSVVELPALATRPGMAGDKLYDCGG